MPNRLYFVRGAPYFRGHTTWNNSRKSSALGKALAGRGGGGFRYRYRSKYARWRSGGGARHLALTKRRGGYRMEKLLYIAPVGARPKTMQYNEKKIKTKTRPRTHSPTHPPTHPPARPSIHFPRKRRRILRHDNHTNSHDILLLPLAYRLQRRRQGALRSERRSRNTQITSSLFLIRQ